MDIHFSKFLTPKIATAVWVITLVVAVLIDLVGFIVAITHSPAFFAAWVLVALLSVLWTLGVRLFLEFVVVQFKQADHLSAISNATDYQAKVVGYEYSQGTKVVKE